MFRKLGRFVGSVVRGLLSLIPVVNVFLLCVVLGTLTKQELEHHFRYNNAYKQMEREHERQLAVANIIASQNGWFEQAELLKHQYLEQKALVQEVSTRYKRLDYQFYHFIQTLKEVDAEAYVKVETQLNKTKPRPIWPFGPWKEAPEPIPAPKTEPTPATSEDNEA